MEVRYITTNDLDEATHWIGLEDYRYKYCFPEMIYQFLKSKLTGKQFCNNTRIILDTPYRLFDCRDDGELVIMDNKGRDINLWLCHNGYFVKKVYQ